MDQNQSQTNEHDNEHDDEILVLPTAERPQLETILDKVKLNDFSTITPAMAIKGNFAYACIKFGLGGDALSEILANFGVYASPARHYFYDNLEIFTNLI